DGLHDLLADLLGGDDLPGVDLAVLVQVDAPFTAAVVEPAVVHLVGLGAGVDVLLAVGLDAVLVVGPDVDAALVDAVILAVEEAAQRAALRVAQQPAGALAVLALVRLDLAQLGLLAVGRAVDHAVLPGAVFQEDVGLGRLRHGLRRGAPDDQVAGK